MHENSAVSEQPEQEGAPRIETERAHFRTLILGNPNYFGNISTSPFTPVVQIHANTTYEEIGCLGFQPHLSQLEAVIFIKRPFGYGGGLCTAGTQEYVRFYLSFDNGATWLDEGMTSFVAHDIPGEQRLEYAVSRRVDPARRFCFSENIIRARAILSWNNPPPANTPNHVPVWGNVVNAHIQVEPRLIFTIGDLFKEIEVKIPDKIGPVIDAEETLAVPQPQALSPAALHTHYANTDVPAHRYLQPALQQMVAHPETVQSLMAPNFGGVLSELKINVANVIGELLKVNGDTRFEELGCVGLDPNLNALIGVLKVKLPNGYAGRLCSAGSTEYVAFWIDWNDGAGLTYAGTASVRVHDIANMPADGLDYAVVLPVDLTKHRRPCTRGPVTAHVRAILSWEVAPPPANPNFVPVWGNRDETRILVEPGEHIQPGVFTPYIYEISRVPVCDIDQTTGMTRGGLQPFGGGITITGEIPAAVGLTVPDTLKYRVSVRSLTLGGGPQLLTDSFYVSTIEGVGASPATAGSIHQTIGGDNFFTYREYGSPLTGAWRRVSDRLLAVWSTFTADAAKTGLWEITIEAKDAITGTPYAAGSITCAIGGAITNVHVLLDERAPSADLAIAGFTRGGTNFPAADCATFQKGDIIHGTYSSFDVDGHFSSLGLTVEPALSALGATVNPSSRSFPTVSTNGEAGTWSLDTSPMDPCGYTIELRVADRTIRDGDASGWQNDKFIGFCLIAAPK
jgi:hypothetical protein